MQNQYEVAYHMTAENQCFLTNSTNNQTKNLKKKYKDPKKKLTKSTHNFNVAFVFCLINKFIYL